MKQVFFSLLAAAGLLAAGCSSSSRDLNEPKADVHMQAGADALERQDYTQALRHLSEAAKLRPKSPEIWSNIGVAYVGKNELTRAEEAWKKTLQISPGYNDARLNLGILYSRQKRYAESEKVFLEAAKDLTYAKLYQVSFQLALVYLQLERPLLAEQRLRASIRENGAFCPAWFQLGMLQRDRGEYSESAESLQGSVKGICYKNPQAHYEIAQLYLKVKDMPQAKSKLLEVIQLFPSSEWAQRAEATLNMIR